MSNESTSLFMPQPLTLLLLIENSPSIFPVWRDLQQYYLPSLIDSIAALNNPALTSLAVITSVDSPPQQIPFPPSAFNIDFSADGRISPSRVNDCIQHLDETIDSSHPSPTMHLVIVAASTPSDDCTGLNLSSGNAPWGILAEKLSERNIHCHLILVSGEDTSPLSMLFEQTLYLQNNVEEPPPFQIDQHRYTFRLSARPLYPQHEQNPSTYASMSARRTSHLDSNSDGNLPPPSSVSAFPPQNEISLVSHLKLAQGLIKKKQHSKDPQPAPFIADVRVQDPTSQPYPIIPSSSPTPVASPSSTSSSSSASSSTSPPTSATTSLSSIPLTSRHRKPQSLAMAGFSNAPPDAIISPTNGGRALSISKADRMQRLSQASSGSSPTESVHAHMRRSSQPQIQGIGSMNPSGQGGSPGAWFASNSHGPPQMHHVQRGSRLSTPDLDVSMSSPGLSAGGLGQGSANGAPSSAGGRGATSAGGANTEIVAPEGSAPPSIGNYDISPGSVSSYISSDISSPATPGSTEDLFSYARHQQGISYQIPYQQNGGSQDGLWPQGQHWQQSVQPSQMQEVQALQHQEHFTQLHQTAPVQHSHFYPGAYDPTSNYFPTVPTQQYYLPQQSSTHHPVNESGYSEDRQTQQSCVPLHRQAMQKPQTLRQSSNSYFNSRPTGTASPPPMIVPSQSHVPLTAVNQVPGAVSTTLDMTGVPRSSPPRPTPTRTSSGQQAQGRARASTVATSSNLKNNSSPSKIAKSKKHKKSASSSVSHSSLVQSTDPQFPSSVSIASPAGDEIFEVTPLYAASTGVLFESMFNIKSGLLDGPGALANAEDIALVSPALIYGEGPNVLATFPSDTVEAAGGLFRSRLKERGGVVDEMTGTALVPVPAAVVSGTIHDDNSSTVSPTGVGQSSPSTKADIAAMQSFVDSNGASMYPPPSQGSASMVSYSYEEQQVPYGTLNGQPNYL